MSAPAPRTRGLITAGLTAGLGHRFGWLMPVGTLATIGLVFWLSPPALVFGLVAVIMLRRRPDRLVWLLVASVGVLLALVVYLAGPDLATARAEWVDALVRGGARGNPWPLVAWSLVLTPVVGALGAWSSQVFREWQRMGGPTERRRRERVEADRKRLVAHKMQAVRLDAKPRPGWQRSAARPLAVSSLGTRRGVILGWKLAGDLRWPMVKGRPGLMLLPVGAGVQHLVLLGATRRGKSEIALRLIEWRIGRPGKVIFLNCKQPTPGREPARRLAAAAERHGRTFRALVRDVSGFDLMRGTRDEIRNRLLSSAVFGDEYYEDVSEVLLALALDLAEAQGRPLSTLPELVWSLPRGELARLAATSPDPRVSRLVEGLTDRETNGAVMRWTARARALLGWIAPAEAGGWSWEDADVIAVDLPTSTEQRAAKMLLRAMLTDLEQWIADPNRRDMSEPVLLVIEEVGALDADPVLGQRLVNLAERAGGAGLNLVVVAQAPSGLGEPRAVEAMLSNCCTITTTQTDAAAVERLASLAGTEEVAEASAAYEGTLGIAPGSGSIRAQQAFKVDPNLLRNLGQGEAVIFDNGRWAHVAAVMAEAGYRRPDGAAVERLTAMYDASRLRPVEPSSPASPAAITDGTDDGLA